MNEVVEITVDSGAARSVWPRRKKGVKRRMITGRMPKLQSANKTEITVHGDAWLEFEMATGVKFLDTDVKNPSGAVSPMEDEGNSVCFSNKWGRFTQSLRTLRRA